jgi:hypothetical protein
MPWRADALRELIAKRPRLRGLVIRHHGTHLILSREEKPFPDHPPILDERVRITWLADDQYGLSARDWQGKRWDPMPFSGNLTQLLDVLEKTLPYLIAPLSAPSS